VVARLAQMTQDLAFTSGIQSGAEHDFLKELA
jgi:hypothetical protein